MMFILAYSLLRSLVNPDELTKGKKSPVSIIKNVIISIALIAPLGLALYWLINNILMTVERLILNKVIKDEEEKPNA